jgi:hypothetical protein
LPVLAILLSVVFRAADRLSLLLLYRNFFLTASLLFCSSVLPESKKHMKNFVTRKTLMVILTPSFTHI